MDQSNALFKKIKGRDRSSFEALSENYGWKLYSYIRRNTEDRATADRIFSNTFSAFYDAVGKYESEDPIETMLYICADQASCGEKLASHQNTEMSQWAIGHEAGFSLPEVMPQEEKKAKESVGMKIFYFICIFLLVVGIAAAVWILLWMLMNMDLMPWLDLGYTWFNQHILDIF